MCAAVDSLGDEELTVKCTRGIGEGVMFYTGHDLERAE